MAAPRAFHLVDAARRRLRGNVPVAEMTRAQIAEARGPYAPTGDSLPAAVLRRLTEAAVGASAPGVATTEVTVPGADGDLPARLHTPASPAADRPLFLHLHGGGWVVGGPIQYDPLCTRLVADVGAVVVSVDYRKAPEHPAPAAPDDAVTVATWLAGGGGAELGAPGPLVVGGDSAGGNLSALVAVALRDRGVPLAGQVLIYPATDLTASTPSATHLTHEPILHRTDIDGFLSMYLAGGTNPTDPRISPRFVDDLHGLAPALVVTAGRDPLKDEGRIYADLLDAAGVTVRHTEYLDMPHGFVSLPGLNRSGRQAIAEIVTFTGRVSAG